MIRISIIGAICRDEVEHATWLAFLEGVEFAYLEERP